ncbi:MAG: hypothetical protein AAGE84_30270 [Cyanobacteria bacterium P01_G01_bin.39]
MTNPDTKQQYEGAILNQLVKNAEKLAVIELKFRQVEPKIEKIGVLEEKIEAVEQKVDKIYSALSTLKWISVTIGIEVVINIFSQPILSRLF